MWLRPSPLLVLALCACTGSIVTGEGEGSTVGSTEPDAGVTMPRPDADPDAEPNTDNSANALCVDIINDYRAGISLPPLSRWQDGEACADGQAESDSNTGVPHGAFPGCGEMAQNECPGWPGPVESMLSGCLASMWAEGPGEDYNAHGHYLNMASTSYTQVSCGVHQTSGGGYWSVQNFR